MLTCDIGRPGSALCLKIATIVAAIENAAKRIATIDIIREKASKPDKKKKMTDALNTMTALQRQWKVGLASKRKKKEQYVPQGKCMHG